MNDNKAILEHKLEQIDEFFENLSVEEFEKGMLDAGAGVISDCGQSTFLLNEGKYINLKTNTANKDVFSIEDDLRGAA